MIELLNIDCMQYMATLPDKAFDLAIVDPPYGIGAGSVNFKNGTSKNDIGYKKNDWDTAIPNQKYFDELMRVSKNQIVWGGNYFGNLWPCRGYIIWDKGTGENSYADCELAWSSIDGVSKIYDKTWVGANAKDKDGRYHPTQKPVALYKWLLKNYAKEGDKILDTHFGSLSIGIACADMGFDLTACEMDKDYFHSAIKRLNNHVAQTNAFQERPIIKIMTLT
jgi:site-specific DNA-methyltransferase (adenine-specific)